MKPTYPKISVIMPVYNGDKYLKEAINSILNQTFSDFEFIIINDGSIDNTDRVIKSFSNEKIVYVNLDNNMGNYHARNLGISMAKGKYICVMDSDDISHSKRLQIQNNFLDNNKNVAACGTPARIIGTNKVWTRPKGYDDLRVAFIENSFCIHPSIMIRTSILKNHDLLYDTQFKYAADYDLISNIMVHSPVVNIDNVLLDYRLHESQITTKHYKEQQYFADLIRLKQLSRFDIFPTTEEKVLHLALLKGKWKDSKIRFVDFIEWTNYLIEKNNKVGYFQTAKLIFFLRGKLKRLKFILDKKLVHNELYDSNSILK